MSRIRRRPRSSLVLAGVVCAACSSPSSAEKAINAESVALGVTSSTSVKIDVRLSDAMSAASPSALLSAIVTYASTPTDADIQALRSFGVQYGVRLAKLPMVGVWANASQLSQIASLASVNSLYQNSSLQYFNREGTALIGASEQRTRAGWRYSGKGVGVAIVDSGIDATHPDLPYGSHVKQNAKVVMGNPSDLGVSSPFFDIQNVQYAEGLADSDTTSGHGTHCAGSVGGLGTQSGGLYAGVAPGADLIGVSTGEAISILWALEGWDYVLTHQYLYNIKVVSNSWGTSGAFDPNDPINVASKQLHDYGITVVFAAGNAGSASNTMNPYSVAPWVIGVAAADKQGRLATFSSRGILDDGLYHPTIAAPGVDIHSTKANGTALGAASPCTDVSPTLAPWYACMSGTSMATPHTAGAVALMLEANPSLGPDDIKSLFSKTATPMAGYQSFEVGAGFLNVMAALDVARDATRASQYGAVLSQTYNAGIVPTGSTSESWDQAWNPAQPPPQHTYTVNTGASFSDVFIRWDDPANTFNLAVTDPTGKTTSTGSNLLAAIEGQSAGQSFSAPASGGWTTTVYGLKGQSTGTTGVGVTDTVHGTVLNYYGALTGLNDIAGSPYAPFIRRAATLHLMDSDASGNFRPASNLTRGEAARIIASDCDVRQNMIVPLPLGDVSPALLPYVNAVATPGDPLRDTFMKFPAVMPAASSSAFNPTGSVPRADLAIWLVRALGMDADAQASMTSSTTFTDDASIPAAARGYVVVASKIGLMPGFVDPTTVEGAPVTYSWRPTTNVVRGAMAVTIDRWYDLFHN